MTTDPVTHVGLLTVRNEPDVLPAALAHHAARFTDIVVLDGSTRCPRKLYRTCPSVKKLFQDRNILKKNERFCDAHRRVPLEWIRDHYPPETTWITLLHADEFWWDNPLAMAALAHAEDCTFILWGEYRFFLHTTDRDTLDLRAPVTRRLTWYVGPFFEVRQFRLREHQTYVPGRDHQTLPVGLPGRRWPIIPRYRHYPYRSPAQVVRAYLDKCATRSWQPDHDWLGARPQFDPFVRHLPKPHNSPLAKHTWDRVRRFDGNLPNPARFLPEWWTG